MRSDAYIKETLAKCDVLKRAGLWPAEPQLRPRAWLENFEESDQHIAAFLLDKFTFYNKRLTDALLVSSYNSIGDGTIKGPSAPDSAVLMNSLKSAIFTPVKGEKPNPTDSGYVLCRKARQLLKVDEAFVLDTPEALSHAYGGGTVIFIDDFVGSGDQFISTWRKPDNRGRSFDFAQRDAGFVAIYITLVSTDFGLENIHKAAPTVAVCTTHVLEKRSTIYGVLAEYPNMRFPVMRFLKKYTPRLRPSELYIANNPKYLVRGYKIRGLMFGFEHSIPDATLPIFWAPGVNDWEPLIERN